MAESAASPLPEGIHNSLHESLPEWLHNSFKPDAAIVPSDVFVALATSFVLGCVVAGIYRLVYGKPRGQAVGLMASLVLLTVLISMVTMVVPTEMITLERRFGRIDPEPNST